MARLVIFFFQELRVQTMIRLGAQMVKDRLSPDSAGVGFGSIHSSNFPLHVGSLQEELR